MNNNYYLDLTGIPSTSIFFENFKYIYKYLSSELFIEPTTCYKMKENITKSVKKKSCV